MMKEQYLFDIGENQNHFPFENEHQALERVKQIYRTARVGNIENQAARNLKDYLINIFANRNAIPSTIENYSAYTKKHIKEISILISQNNYLKFGIAQKVFNLFMKDLWAWNKLTRTQEKVLHFTLDRVILNYLRKSPWKAWTKIYTTNEEYNNTFQIYLEIQKVFRNQLRYFHFNTAIELEQYLWHKFK